jgi:hypothetical protein
VKDDPGFEEEGGAAGGTSRDCGDFADHCTSGYTFFRRDTQGRATADQFDPAHEYVYVVYDATKPGTENTPTGTTYYTTTPGHGGQAAIFFTRLNGANGQKTAPAVIDNQARGHQVFPDVSADNPAAASRGTVHTLWWDSRNDVCYSPALPIGNCPNRTTTLSLDSWGAVSHAYGDPGSWASSRISDVTSNPNFEQFDNRSVPFAGDYLYVSSLNDLSFGVWTDWRLTNNDQSPAVDPREAPEDEDGGTADVIQCRTFSNGAWSGDQCPHNGGLDQNIFGDLTP